MRLPLSLVGLAGVAWILAAAPTADAIPSFARRYETSCQTCHVAYPRLTPFGEAFRRNAYRFPGGGDETAQKEEPLALGTEVHQELWPAAVWPGEMPRSLPLSITLNGKAAFGGGGHAHGGTTTDSHGGGSQVDLGSLGGQIGLRAAGTLGSAAAVFASIDFGGHAPVAVERGFVVLTPWNPAAFQVRLGRFDPSLHGVSIHRSLLPHDQPVTTTAVGLNPFTPEPSANGVELSGVFGAGRLGWVAGAVENVTPNSFNVKDLYARVEGKLGGMRLDGLEAEAGKAAWSERSVLLGLSGWLGRAALATKTGSHLRDDQFLRLGADLHAIFDDLLLDVVAARQQHDGPLATAGEVTTDLLSAELTWMVTAFAFPTLRLDANRQETTAKTQTGWTAQAMATAVVRPNLLVRVQAGYGADAGDHADFRSAALSFSAAF